VEKEKEPVGTSCTHANSWASSPPYQHFNPLRNQQRPMFKPSWNVYEELPKGKPLAKTIVHMSSQFVPQLN